LRAADSDLVQRGFAAREEGAAIKNRPIGTVGECRAAAASFVWCRTMGFCFNVAKREYGVNQKP